MGTAVALAVLAVVLWSITRPPGRARPWPEVAVTAPAAVLLVVTGLEPVRAARHQVGDLAGTLVFLAAVFVVAEAADAAGVFDLAGSWLARVGRRSDGLLVAGSSAVAVVTTTLLSLDTTVVLLTPVVARAVRRRAGRTAHAAVLSVVLLANGGSLLLPVANLTNLLVVRRLHLGYTSFAAHLALPGLASAAVITAGCVWSSRRRAPTGEASGAGAGPMPETGTGPGGQAHAGTPADENRGCPGTTRPPDGLTSAVAAGVAVLAVAFVAASAAGTSPAWPAVGGALVLAGLVVAAGRATPSDLLRATGPGFIIFVMALAVVVDAASRHGLGPRVVDLLPAGGGLWAMLGIAAVAVVLANLVNNLPATLLLLPALALRTTPVALAALVGLNVGPNLTYPGSLATLLWRRQTRRLGMEPPLGRYLTIAWAVTPLAVAAAVVALWLVSGMP